MEAATFDLRTGVGHYEEDGVPLRVGRDASPAVD